jgi:hypothetical protein
VKHFFDVPRQVDRHPWLMMGGSVLLGYLGGRLLTPRRARASAETPASRAEPAPPPAAAPHHNGAHARREPERQEPERKEEPRKEGWLSRLGDQFGDELSKLKGLAVGTLLGVARDMVSRVVPETLKEQVTELVDGMTTRLGGKIIHGPVLGGESDGEEAAAPQDGGRTAGQARTPEMAGGRR